MDSWNILWEQVSWKDAVDIGLVAVLLYQALLIVRGTRAVQMLIGMAFLIFLYVISFSYELFSLRWMLDNFFESFFIVVAIVFQEEIRNTLANFGRQRSFFWPFGREEDVSVEINEVVEACAAMSKDRVGALIVFAKESELGEYINTGTCLRGEVHADFMYAVFQSNSPLHDGAAIISKGKLMAAGCLLPLSKKTELDRHLGTRHRAALGVSEITDGVAIVVSEERGEISVGYKGRLYPGLSITKLRRFLKLFLSKKRTTKDLELNKTRESK